MKLRCDNCGKTFSREGELDHKLPDIQMTVMVIETIPGLAGHHNLFRIGEIAPHHRPVDRAEVDGCLVGQSGFYLVTGPDNIEYITAGRKTVLHKPCGFGTLCFNRKFVIELVRANFIAPRIGEIE